MYVCVTLYIQNNITPSDAHSKNSPAQIPAPTIPSQQKPEDKEKPSACPPTHSLFRPPTAVGVSQAPARNPAGFLAGSVDQRLLSARFYSFGHPLVLHLSTSESQSPPQPYRRGCRQRRCRPPQPSGQGVVAPLTLRGDDLLQRCP